MKNVLITIGVIIALFAIIFAANEFEIFGTKFWGVRKENARREVFEQTQSYVEGKRQEITKYRLEYQLEKDTVAKEAIRQTIITSFANFDVNKLSPDLIEFLNELKNK